MKGLSTVSGYRYAGVKAGIKRSGNHDIGIIVADNAVNAAGVFTQNKVRAAPVKVSEEHLKKSQAFKAIIVNAGNANACTGEEGQRNAEEMCALTAAALHCQPQEVLVCSTGVIGSQMPMQKIREGLSHVVKEALEKSSPDLFVKAILTTDIVEKQAEAEFVVGGRTYYIGGAAKGSGMIHPNMATTLSFIVTDFPVMKEDLQSILFWCAERSLNCLSVDGDTSTNDSLLIFAPKAEQYDRDHLEVFKEKLLEVCRSLARQIAKDGEGAEHLITLRILNVSDFHAGRNIARAIANSPLVKTAVAGCDPNWGRILCAIGYSGEQIEESKIQIRIEDVTVFDGEPQPFNALELSKKMHHKELVIEVVINSGKELVEYYTCDLTHGYITINADYHT